MEKKYLAISAAILAGLVFIGIMLPVSVRTLRSYDRIVAVKGLCEREVKADKAIWPMVFKVVGDNLGAVYSGIEANTAGVVAFLEKNGFSKDEISSSIPEVSDKYAQEYNSNRTYRYVAKCVVTLCSSDVDKVLAAMASQNKLLRDGIALEHDWNNKTEFSFEGLNTIKPEMIEEATRNAREVAQKFAKDSESRLGKIKDASQGTFSISDRDSNTPYIKKVRVVTYVSYYLSK